MILFGLSVCQFRASRGSGGPAVGYCLFFLCVTFGPRGTLGSNCQVLSDLFLCQYRASGDALAPAVGYCLVFFLIFSIVLLDGRKDGMRKGRRREEEIEEEGRDLH